jgi:hypothetical protein
VVNVAANLILPLRICNDLFAFEPELLRLVILARREFVMSGSAAETALLRPIGTVRILAILEIEPDLIEAVFRDKVVLLAKVAPVDDRVD